MINMASKEMTSLEDPCSQILKMCDMWWDTRDIKANQAFFQEGGKFNVKDGLNTANWWMYEIRAFLNSTFSYVDESGGTHEFVPLDLEAELRNRLISQLGCGIGLFYRDFLAVAKKMPELN